MFRSIPRFCGVAVAAVLLVVGGCTSTPDGGLLISSTAGSASVPGTSVSNGSTSAATSSRSAPSSSRLVTTLSPSATSVPPSASSVGTPSTPGAVHIAQVSTVTTGLHTPWGLAFLPDGSALVTERDTAKVLHVTPAGAVTELGTISGVSPAGEGGLLGIAVDPHFATSKLAVVYYTAAQDNRIATVKVTGTGLAGQHTILSGIPKGSIHNGGRLAFGPDGLLYAGTGENGTSGRAQDLASLGGKILRLKLDGSAPSDNPFPQAPLVYSLGHRNVQGLAFDAQGRLWASEFGQDTWDELNLIKAGDNDGWPTVEGPSTDSRFVAPVRVWATSDASPSGIAIAGGSVWMAALRGERLWQIPLTGATTQEPIALLSGEYGRLRTVVTAPDGSLWLTTSNTDGRGDPQQGDDRILRLSLT